MFEFPARKRPLSPTLPALRPLDGNADPPLRSGVFIPDEFLAKYSVLGVSSFQNDLQTFMNTHHAFDDLPSDSEEDSTFQGQSHLPSRINPHPRENCRHLRLASSNGFRNSGSSFCALFNSFIGGTHVVHRSSSASEPRCATTA